MGVGECQMPSLVTCGIRKGPLRNPMGTQTRAELRPVLQTAVLGCAADRSCEGGSCGEGGRFCEKSILYPLKHTQEKTW